MGLMALVYSGIGTGCKSVNITAVGTERYPEVDARVFPCLGAG